MEYNYLFAIISGLLSISSSIIFLTNVLNKKIQPHAFTFLIWLITQGTAIAAILVGGGGIGALGLILGECFMIVVFVLSLKYGTKNITKSDIIMLSIAIVAIIVWWKVNSPLYAVLLVVLIDIMGYGPTIRKTYVYPQSERMLPWLLGAGNMCFAILALESYSILTVAYPAALCIGNLSVATTRLLRRKY